MSTGNSQNTGTADNVNLLALPTGVELGSYRILHTLGQGGFGITYLAEFIANGEHVVIKENLPSFCALRDRTTLEVAPTNPNDELQEYAQYLKRFVDEARLLAQLNHPNIVKVLGAFEALGTAYYVMPWVGGKELHKAAPAPGAITQIWLLPILRTLLGTLEYLHNNNIYHRDVKPANVLLTEDGMPILIDFGTARAIISDRSATHVGSPGYSPVEQITSKGKRGPWTDVYSLGATCYRLITGEHPPEATERLVEEDDPLQPLASRIELHERFSPDFLATIDKALALRGKGRWQTAIEWIDALPIPALQPEPISQLSPDTHTSPIVVSAEPTRRRRTNTVLILLILIFTLGIPGGYMLYQHNQAVAEQRQLAQQKAEQKAKEEAKRKARQEAARKAKEEAERKARQEAERRAKEEAERKAVAEQARNAKRFAQLLQQMHTGLSSALKELPPAAGRVANGQQLSEQTSLLQHFNTLRQTAAEANALSSKLPAKNISGACNALPAEPPAFRSFIVDCCNNYAVGSLSDKHLLTLLGWDAALATAQKEAKRKSTEEARRILSGKGISSSEYNSKIRSAAGDGDTELLTLLINAGADVNAADEHGRTPLSEAASYGHQGHRECMKLLLANPAIDLSQWSPLTLAIWENNVEKLRQLLTSPGINVNKADKNRMTPLHWATWKGHTECLQLLLSAPGIDVNKVNMAGQTALHLAAGWDYIECVKLLLAAPGIDINKVNKAGQTPLREAYIQGSNESTKLIRKAGGRLTDIPIRETY